MDELSTPELLAHYTTDASSMAADGYDALAGSTDPLRIVEDDIAVMYRTMRVRSRRDAWDVLLVDEGPRPWLRALDSRWNLLELDDGAWTSAAPSLEKAFDAMIGPHRQLTGVSKILHLKRPRLVPILDLLVVEQLGGRGRSPIALAAHYRSQLVANRSVMEAIVTRLSEVDGLVRTPVRVMDALLWTAHPGASLAKQKDGWQRRFSRRAAA